jgi:hypothetical protein
MPCHEAIWDTKWNSVSELSAQDLFQLLAYACNPGDCQTALVIHVDDWCSVENLSIPFILTSTERAYTVLAEKRQVVVGASRGGYRKELAFGKMGRL